MTGSPSSALPVLTGARERSLGHSLGLGFGLADRESSPTSSSNGGHRFLPQRHPDGVGAAFLGLGDHTAHVAPTADEELLAQHHELLQDMLTFMDREDKEVGWRASRPNRVRHQGRAIVLGLQQ